MKNPSIMVLTLLMILILHAHSGNSSLAPALYIFGDSLMDNGNNNLLPTTARADFLPYGMNFDGGCTGRFTNGKTVADFIAEFLGLSYPPSYTNLLLVDKLRLTMPGTNFASGSCGILPETGYNLGKCLNLEDQINLFQAMVGGEQFFSDSDKISTYLSQSVFLFSIGSNDYLANYLNKAQYFYSTVYTPESFAQYLVEILSQQLQKLYDVGARKFVVFGIGPVGCIPSITKVFGQTGLCNKEINQFPEFFNKNLTQMLDNLTSRLEGSTFINGQVYSLAYDAVFKPSKYGLIDSSNPCCTTILNGTGGCMTGIENGCKDPNKHYYFDGFHLTETLYKTIALRCFNDSSVCKPKNIQQLVQATS